MFFFKRLLLLFSLSFNAFSSTSSWMPFALDDGHITVPVKIFGHEASALLDTGAMGGAISENFLEKHKLTPPKGPRIILKGAFGKDTRSTYNNIPAEMFGGEIELDRMISISNSQHDLILGATFFSQFIVQIDYVNNRIRLIERELIDLSKHKNIQTEIDRISGNFIAKLEFGSEYNEWFLVDTGFTGGLLLTNSFARDIGINLENPDRTAMTKGVISEKSLALHRYNHLKFGPFEMENVATLVSDTKIQIKERDLNTMHRFKGRNIKGLIGYDVFKHFVLTIDYREGAMHIGLPE